MATPRRGPRVVVVGGGAVGLCAAIALAERSVQVTLIERGLPGAANSTLTGGGIRQQFGTVVNIALSKLSAPFWSDFERSFGVDPLLRPIGYLFLAKAEAEASAIASQVALQNSLGVDSEWLGGEEVERRWPCLKDRGFVGGSFRQQDGWANQHRILDGLCRGALRAGVELHAGTEALALVERAGIVDGVVSTAGHFMADAVVLAVGPWCEPLLTPLGLSVPVFAHRHELLILEVARPLPPDLPWLIGVGDQVHLRPDAPGRVLLGGFLGHDMAGDARSWARLPDPKWTREVIATAERLFGVIDSDAVVRHGWAGLYPSTPDRHPIVDRLCPGLYATLGLSGTGLMHAPAVGGLLADIIMERERDPALVQALSCSRFSAAETHAQERTGF